jgi:TRAP-type transport system periplasmic protein
MKTILKRGLALLALASAMTMAIPAHATDFRIGTIVPAGHLWSQGAEAMGQKISERSNGEHSVTVYPAGQLGDESQMVQQLQSGALDMAFLTIADVSNRVPAFSALYAPFLVNSAAEGASLLRSDPAQELLDLLPQQMGVVGVGYGIAAMRLIMVTRPVETVQDLAGKKMRITPFKPLRDFYNLLGIAPTPMPLPDVYDALANGQVDAIDIDPELILNFKFHERARHLLVTNHSMFPMVGLISGRVWAGLSDEDKELLRTAMEETLDEILNKYGSAEKEWMERIRATGIEVKDFGADKFSGIVEQWEEMWVEQKPLIDRLREEAAAL